MTWKKFAFIFSGDWRHQSRARVRVLCLEVFLERKRRLHFDGVRQNHSWEFLSRSI